MCASPRSSERRRGPRPGWVGLCAGLVAALAAGCRAEDTVRRVVADGASIAPEAEPAAYAERLATLGVKRLLVPWTTPATDVEALAAAARRFDLELVVGLTASRAPEDEWNTPLAPPTGLAAALARAQRAGDALAGVHLDHAAPGLPDEGFVAYLEATVAELRAATRAPIGFALRQRTLGVAQLQEGGFPAPPPGTRPADLDARPAAIAWANAWAGALAGRVDRVVLQVDDAARADHEAMRGDAERLRDALGGRAELWASVDLLSPLAPARDTPLARVRPARPRAEVIEEVQVLRSYASAVLVRGAESFAPEELLAPEGRTRDAPPEAPSADEDARAEAVNARLRRCCLRDGQVVSVYDHRFEPEHGDNVWQEDACWLTGLYTAALAFRAQVLGTEAAAAEARAAWGALHQLAHTSPLEGEVVRSYARALYGTQPRPPSGGTRKRWHRAPDRELYWVGDVSVDQLSGWFFGVAAYHDLVADAGERATIAADLRAVLDLLLAHELHAVEFDGGRTTYGDLRAQPVLALAFFQIGWHVTGEARYRATYERLMDDEGAAYAIGNVLAAYHGAGRFGSDHFYASAFLPLLGYETDRARRELLEVALDVFHQLERRFGNAYADAVYGALHPTSDARRRAARELARYLPAQTSNAAWLAAHAAYPPGPFVSIDQRPAAELDFDYVPPGPAALRGGLEHRYSGVGFLVAYWMSRWHGWPGRGD